MKYPDRLTKILTITVLILIANFGLSVLSILASSFFSEPINSTLFYVLSFVGLFQLIYVIPLIYFHRRTGDRDTMYGVIVGAILTFFLNGVTMRSSYTFERADNHVQSLGSAEPNI